MTTKRLASKCVIVTGAGQGIGAVYARALAAEGASLAICDLKDPTRTREELSSSGTRVLSGSVDITDAAAVSAFIARSEKELGPTDVLVNNAALFGPFDQAILLGGRRMVNPQGLPNLDFQHRGYDHLARRAISSALTIRSWS